jgi:hypothetical protein
MGGREKRVECSQRQQRLHCTLPAFLLSAFIHLQQLFYSIAAACTPIGPRRACARRVGGFQKALNSPIPWANRARPPSLPPSPTPHAPLLIHPKQRPSLSISLQIYLLHPCCRTASCHCSILLAALSLRRGRLGLILECSRHTRTCPSRAPLSRRFAIQTYERHLYKSLSPPVRHTHAALWPLRASHIARQSRKPPYRQSLLSLSRILDTFTRTCLTASPETTAGLCLDALCRR